MTEEEFTRQLQRLISRARDAFPLERTIGLIEVELEGLKMAEAEGEEQ
jgi:hypothetical protein